MVYSDPAVTEIAIAGLHGLKMGDRTLTVRRAEVGWGGGAEEGGGCVLQTAASVHINAELCTVPGSAHKLWPVLSQPHTTRARSWSSLHLLLLTAHCSCTVTSGLQPQVPTGVAVANAPISIAGTAAAMPPMAGGAVPGAPLVMGSRIVVLQVGRAK